jgi:hypothetical protein
VSKIFITTTAKNTRWDPYARSNYDRIIRAAEAYSGRDHSIAISPSEADSIVFVGSSSKFHFDVLESELYRKFRSNSLIFDFQDNTIPRVAGIYMTIPYALRTPIYKSGFYVRVFDNSVLDDDTPFSQCTYLFSFIGRVVNCPHVRNRVVRLEHPRAYLEDAWSHQSDSDKRYAGILQKSKFILCPRGYGASTWRLFETMRAGRVPVIISDEWLAPGGLEWDKFSIRVPEREVDRIPAALEALEEVSEEMGLAARKAWEDNFSVAKSFGWIAETTTKIQSVRSAYAQVENRITITETLNPLYRRSYYREVAREVMARVGMLGLMRQIGFIA